RRVWPLLPGNSLRGTVEAYEWFTDGRLSADKLVDVCVQAELETEEGIWRQRRWCWCCDFPDDEARWDPHLRQQVADTIAHSAEFAARMAVYAVDLAAWHAKPKKRETVRQAERRAQFPIYRDIFATPRYVRLDPSCLRFHEGVVRNAARVIHA